MPQPPAKPKVATRNPPPTRGNPLPKFSEVLRSYRDPTYYRYIPKTTQDPSNALQQTPFDTLEQEAPGVAPEGEVPTPTQGGGLHKQGLDKAISDIQTQRELESPTPMGPVDMGSARKQLKRKGQMINDLQGR